MFILQGPGENAVKRVQTSLYNYVFGSEQRMKLWSQFLPDVTASLNSKVSATLKVSPGTAFRGRNHYEKFATYDWQNDNAQFDPEKYDSMIDRIVDQRQKRIQRFKDKNRSSNEHIRFTIGDHVYIIADRAKWNGMFLNALNIKNSGSQKMGTSSLLFNR